jgi:hypothetical protein
MTNGLKKMRVTEKTHKQFGLIDKTPSSLFSSDRFSIID